MTATTLAPLTRLADAAGREPYPARPIKVGLHSCLAASSATLNERPKSFGTPPGPVTARTLQPSPWPHAGHRAHSGRTP